MACGHRLGIHVAAIDYWRTPVDDIMRANDGTKLVLQAARAVGRETVIFTSSAVAAMGRRHSANLSKQYGPSMSRQNNFRMATAAPAEITAEACRSGGIIVILNPVAVPARSQPHSAKWSCRSLATAGVSGAAGWRGVVDARDRGAMASAAVEHGRRTLPGARNMKYAEWFTSADAVGVWFGAESICSRSYDHYGAWQGISVARRWQSGTGRRRYFAYGAHGAMRQRSRCRKVSASYPSVYRKGYR
jgi:hypothetical protein